jgi:hypothetical protein
MKVQVVTCFPLTLVRKLGGIRSFTVEMEAEPTELVKDFKARYLQEGKAQAHSEYDVTVCVEGQERMADQHLWDAPEFAVDRKTQQSFIHLRVEDPELNARAKEFAASPTIFMPLEMVRSKNEVRAGAAQGEDGRSGASAQQGEGERATDTARSSPSSGDNDEAPVPVQAHTDIDG